MAVPISKRKDIPSIPNRRSGDALRLEYSDKKDIKDILALPTGNFIPDSPSSTGTKNRFYQADNLLVLPLLALDPSICGNVRLVYIDPPFSTAASFESRQQKHAYDDILVGSKFIESLRERLVFIHKILSNDGSLYLHLDERMIFYMKVILDEIFGVANFRNCIVRKKCNPKNYTKKTYGNTTDYILFYTKSNSYVWNRPFEPWNEEKASKEYQCVDEEGNAYKKVPVHAPGIRNGETGKPWRGVMPPQGKHWQYSPATLDEMDKRGEIYWSATGNPRRKIYFKNSKGIPIQNIWLDVKDAHNQNIKITGYPTEKNPDLLSRIIEASSNSGDIVLDCYAGSGTTLFVASQLNRNWIGVDNSEEAVKTIFERFKYGSRRMGDFVNKFKQLQPTSHPNAVNFTLYKECEYCKK